MPTSLLATDSSTALRVWESRNRSQWPAYLVCEYEPARLAPGLAYDRAVRSFELGLDMLVVDPVVADLLANHRHSRITLLPTRIPTEPKGFSGHADPTMVFAVSSSDGVPDTVWTELALALELIKADHPHIRIVLGGQAATRGELSAMDLPHISAGRGRGIRPSSRQPARLRFALSIRQTPAGARHHGERLPDHCGQLARRAPFQGRGTDTRRDRSPAQGLGDRPRD